MAKIISLFNHKGGVSKTTTTFNLGWSLAELGLKVLIVDADPQCNLTAYCLGLDSQIKLDLFYEKKGNDNIYDASKSEFRAGDKNKKPYNLIDISDFNSLILISQQHSKPVFELIEAEINQKDIVLQNQQGKQKEFKEKFTELAIEVAKLTKLPEKKLNTIS
jgi:cellulose biosynthesis protein BcsQ